jgi:uncharacterized protein (DUF2267 family)
MSLTGLEVFDETIQKTNIWLKEIVQALGPDRRRAYQTLRAVLHCLRDRLTVEETVQLGAQLPMLVRGFYYEGWVPTGKPKKIRSRDEFLGRISERLPSAQLIDPEVAARVSVQLINPEVAARVVFQVLENHVSPGEIGDVVATLPQEIRTLWPGAQSGP